MLYKYLLSVDDSVVIVLFCDLEEELVKDSLLVNFGNAHAHGLEEDLLNSEPL